MLSFDAQNIPYTLNLQTSFRLIKTNNIYALEHHENLCSFFALENYGIFADDCENLSKIVFFYSNGYC